MVGQTAGMMCRHASVWSLAIKRRGTTQMLQALHDIRPLLCFLKGNHKVIIQCAKALMCTSYAIAGTENAGRSGSETDHQL